MRYGASFPEPNDRRTKNGGANVMKTRAACFGIAILRWCEDRTFSTSMSRVAELSSALSTKLKSGKRCELRDRLMMFRRKVVARGAHVVRIPPLSALNPTKRAGFELCRGGIHIPMEHGESYQWVF